MSLSDPLFDIPLGRRQVSALVILLTLIVLPHWANLGSSFVVFFLVGAVWRLGCLHWQRSLPGKWLLAGLMLLGIALVFSNVSLRDGRLAGTALLVVMLGLKLMELRSHRDMYIGIFLGFFAILTQFLFNGDLWLALYLFALAALLTGLLVSVNRCRFDAATTLRTAAVQALAAAPVAALLFVLFPRLDAPLWSITLHGDAGLTGISGQIRLGDIGRLSQSGALAFRAEFDTTVPLPSHLYWRGPVLWLFDGKTWTAGNHTQTARTLEVDPDSETAYELTMEPTGQKWVFALDVPTAFPDDLQLNDNHQLISAEPLQTRALYRLTSHTAYRLDELTPLQRRQGLQVPPDTGERTRALARDWRERHPEDDRAVVNAALRFFNREPFVYTLMPGTSKGDPVEDFLFERRRGFCEHYAGSFTLLMRLAGIPARIVAGYQGGSRNPLGNSVSVYQSDAHAWSEVWLEDQGWVRIDPTASVAPERVERSIDIARSASGGEIVFDAGDSSWFRQLSRGGRWVIDAVELNWNRWILGFDNQRQQNLLHGLGLERLGNYAAAVVLGALLLLFVPIFLFLMQRYAAFKGDSLSRDWQRYQRKLQRAGLEVPAWLGPEQLLARAERRWPTHSQALRNITRRYVALRYGSLDSPSRRKQLRVAIRRLRIRPGSRPIPLATGRPRQIP